MNIIKDCEQDFVKLIHWIESEFQTVEHKIAPVIVAVLEKVKVGIADGTLKTIATDIGIITNSPLPLEIEGLIEGQIPRLFATWSNLAGLPPDPTADDLKAVWAHVSSIWNLPETRTDKILSGVAADLYGMVKAAMNFQQNTFAEDVTIIDADFKKIVADFNPA